MTQPQPQRTYVWLEWIHYLLVLIPFFGGLGSILLEVSGRDTFSYAAPLLPSLAFLVQGFVFLSQKRGWRRAPWLGLMPATLLALHLSGAPWMRQLGFEPPILLLDGTLALSSAALPLAALRRFRRWRIPMVGLAGCLTAASGFAALLDFSLGSGFADAFRLPQIEPLSALLLVASGAGLVSFSLDEHPYGRTGGNAWLPIPAIVISATLTFVLWSALREREYALFSESDRHLGKSYLPEITLVAGLGITLLVGLSVHLARSAYSNLREARLSNQKLRGEIDERKRVEAMLKLADERLRLALDSTQIAIFEWTAPRDDLYFSPGLWSMLGFQYEPLRQPGQSWAEFIHPDDRPTYRRATDRHLSGVVSFADPEYRIRAADGSWRWIYARARTVQAGSDGHPLRIIGTLQDVTSRKDAEEALRVSQATTRKLSLVAARTDNLVIIAKPDGTVEWVNESFERIMEFKLDEIVGRNPLDLVAGPETSPRTLRRIMAHMRRGEGISSDIVNYSKSGKKFHLHLEIQPVRNEQGVLENFIAIQADITSRVETERNLRRAKVEADAASKAKSEFLASMSHEIRTPMNGVIGMTSLLLETPLNPEQRDSVTTIRNSGEALLTIINDILDFSKIESGKMELERVPLDLGLCIEDALDLFAVAASAKNIDLAYHIESDVPPWIQGDVTRLRQVMVNLVNNAVKFTPAGRISILVRRIPAPGTTSPLPESVELEIAIVDTGIGIPPERMDRLFKPFTQVDSSTTRKYGGTGLGLAICQRLVSLMGGSIRVSSIVGEGSTFSFNIITPAVPVPPGWGLPESPAQLSYGPVLCVTENPVFGGRLTDFFSSWGARALLAPSLETAVREYTVDPPPIAVLVDSAMLAHESTFRDTLLKSEIPALLMTPPGQSAAAMEVFSGRRAMIPVAKPVRTGSLVRALRKLLSPARDSLPPFSPVRVEKLLGEEIPLDVLLVEDNPVNQKVGLRFLERLGYRADAAGNGLEAVNILEARPYHLVLMDLQMPEMDGLEASRQIRRRLSQERQPKIIALTANALQGDREICLAAGMDDYITKPVKPMEIAKAIRRHFGQANSRAESEDESG
ncbi:MAG: ATP-binding protein [Opitutaceae bacterium]|nr:ATP-binding protein [Opitutaceae bacterium]